MAGTRYPHEAITRILRDWVPEYQRADEESGRDEVHITVWLVGFAAGLITLLAANTSFRDATLHAAGPTPIILLFAVIVIGVAHRIMYRLYEDAARSHGRALSQILTGLTLEGSYPMPPLDSWTIDDIVLRLKEDFGLDYGWLKEYKVPLDKARAAYSGQYVLWQEHEEEGAAFIRSLLYAYAGDSEPTAPSRTSQEKLGSIRAEANRLNGFQRVCFAMHIGAGIAFVLAMGILARVVL